MNANLTETETRTRFITPAIIKSGWDKHQQIREDVFFTDGRIIVQGNVCKRGKRKFADYILFVKSNIPIAVVEAKKYDESIGFGMPQALDYAEILDIPFVYSSNGKGFLEHDRTVSEGNIEVQLALSEFPSPDELWNRYKKAKGITDSVVPIVTQDYYYELDGKQPRYYQRIAVNRTVEAIATGQNRILLVMATGTGKTYTAFQIIWRLWKAGNRKRILFLTDRNFLADQTRNNDFRPFGDKMTKITNRTADKSHEVYIALYQAMYGEEEWQNIYKEYSPSFFDLIVIDECHRGSAADDSAWREILSYFHEAAQIGMTATPKETNDISNIQYFGIPIFTYSLKQGIADGFLAPYKVIRPFLDKDMGWQPIKGKLDKFGNAVEDREYNYTDFDRQIVLEQRTEVIAEVVSNYLKKHGRFDKSIFFCVDIEHAERMRSCLVNQNSDLVSQYPRYVAQITGDVNSAAVDLDDFRASESNEPILVTTSMLLTTGVDIKTCKYIIIDKNINSLIEFKQIIGRGTRIEEEYGKLYFTVFDFRNATRHFADPDFDGEPIQIKTDPDEEDDIDEQDLIEDSPELDNTLTGNPEYKPSKYYINDVEVVVVGVQVRYLDKDGILITESLENYVRSNFLKLYPSEDSFIADWQEAGKKQSILQELASEGILMNELAEAVGKQYDPFDLLCHVAFDSPPLTRKDRADKVKKRNYFTKYEGKAREVLEQLLEKYTEVGVLEIENLSTLSVPPFNAIGTRSEIVRIFGGKEHYERALKELKNELYSA